MKQVKNFASTLKIAGLGAAVLAASAGIPASAATPISVGVMAPKGQILGTSIFDAAELAASRINDSGGINGRKIELHEYDDHFSAANATRAFQRAVEQDHVVAMVGIFTSEIALAEIPWASRLKTPLLISGAASTKIPAAVKAHPEKNKYVFHSYVNSAILAKQACILTKAKIENSDRLKKYNRAVIFSEDFAWTKPLDKAYKKCLPKVGAKVVDTIRFSANTTDFTPIYSRIEKDKANIIMAAIAHTGVKPVVQWHQQQVPALLAGVNGQAGSSRFWNATNGATNGVITGSTDLHGAPLTDKTPGFFKAFTKRFHIKEPAYSAYTTYDAMYSLKHALENAKSTKGDDLVKALENVNFTGVLGKVAFHGNHARYPHEVIFSPNPKKGQSFVGFQWQDGKQVIVWPKRLASGEIKVPSFVRKAN